MNVSMADSFNLGWKLAAVLSGQAKPALLSTYSTERHGVAQELIEFDRDMARLFSARNDTKDTKSTANPDAFQHYFVMHGRYTAGVEVCYQASNIAVDGPHQSLATGYRVGRRFHSATVIRLADAKRVQLGHTIKADGRWRLFAFAPRGDVGDASGPVAALCQFLQDSQQSPVRQFTSRHDEIDAVIDVRAIFQSEHQSLAIEAMHEMLLPRKGRYGLNDYEKIYSSDHKHGPDIFDARGINREHGCIIVVRPDQYVARVLALDEFDALAGFFEEILIPAGNVDA